MLNSRHLSFLVGFNFCLFFVVILFSSAHIRSCRSQYAPPAHSTPLTIRQLQGATARFTPKSVAKLQLFSLIAKHFRNYFYRCSPERSPERFAAGSGRRIVPGPQPRLAFVRPVNYPDLRNHCLRNSALKLLHSSSEIPDYFSNFVLGQHSEMSCFCQVNVFHREYTDVKFHISAQNIFHHNFITIAYQSNMGCGNLLE